jgi:Tol biopolymer transport system component
MDLETRERRFGVPDVTVKWGGCIDTWSSDSRWLASEVVVDGASRILVVDSRTRIGHLVTPEGVTAHCPLWSPDGGWVAFTHELSAGSRTLAIIRTDGSEMREISGRLGGLAVSGPDTWSPDGAWIYFDAQRFGVGRVFRANVAEGQSTPLTDVGMLAAAPASSPDGTQIAFIVSGPGGWDLYAANSDGSNAHRVVEHANNLGWSADSRYILTDWTPPDETGGLTGGLAIVSPDGSDFRIIDPVYKVCPEALGSCDLGWGQARP